MKFLKSKRVLLGISQKELSKRLNVSDNWISLIENGKKKSPKLESRILSELNKIEMENYGINIPTLS